MENITQVETEERKSASQFFFVVVGEQQTFHSGELNLAVGVLINLVLIAERTRERNKDAI